MSELAFTAWQALPVHREKDVVTRGVGPWFAIACILQVH